MNHKFTAAIAVAIFLMGSLAVLNPTQAHFTLGNLTGTYPFHAQDFDPHHSGVIGYVWPGAGQNAYSGSPNVAADNLYPGYQSPYPGGNPPGAASPSWYQLESNSYTPFGAVLTGSTGDLVFAINSTSTRDTLGWGGIVILLPPGFTMPTMDGSNVVSTLTDNYANVFVAKLSQYDRYAPGWTAVQVFADGNVVANPAGTVIRLNHQFINFTSAGEWYYFRINGVTAPSVAGRYFFKMLLLGTSNVIAGVEGTATFAVASAPPTADVYPPPPQIIAGTENATQFLPTENWPVMLVKGELDPAIITGTIRYGGYNASLYGQPISESGRVWAKMTTRLDPYTGQRRPDLPLVDAVGYFNDTAIGHFEVEGIAPGVYDLYASAAGYPQTVIASGVVVLRGQSLHLDGYVQPGAVVHGDVFTKHQFGDQPWPESSYIKIELYDGPTLNHIPDPAANLVSWSPLPCVAGGQDHFYPKWHAGSCDDPRLGSNIAFPWHEYVPANGYGGGPAIPLGYYQLSVSSQRPSSLTAAELQALDMQDPQGVGPPQHWFVTGGSAATFHFEFGVKGEYGAPRDLDGMVPQVYATWVNGLTPGRYYARAWVFRYVQSALDGSTFQEYSFDVTPNEWAGDVSLPMDLRLSSWVNKTVHFHNQLGGLVDDPINTGAGFMSGYLTGADGNVYSYNQTALGAGPDGYPYGPGLGEWPNGGQPFGTAGGNAAVYGGDITGVRPCTVGLIASCAGSNSGVDLDKGRVNADALHTGTANIQFWGINDTWSGENYGIPSGSYSVNTFVLGYLPEKPPEQVSVTLSGSPTSISDHMVRGVGFNLTVFSIDWERPTVNRVWEFGNPTGFDPWFFSVGAEIDVGFYSNGSLVEISGDVNFVNYAWATSIVSTGLYQGANTGDNPGATSFLTPLVGGGIRLTDSRGSIQSAFNAFFGNELKRAGFVGGYTAGKDPAVFPFLASNSLRPKFKNPYVLEPTALDGGQYDLRGFSYGYVQHQTVSVFGERTQIVNARINLVRGVNVTVDVLFKKESVITPTPANMSARLRIFNNQNQLVGEWTSSEGVFVTGNGHAAAADGTSAFPFGPIGINGGLTMFCISFPVCGVTPSSGDLDFNFLPGGVTLLHAVIAGLPQVPAAGANSPYDFPSSQYVGDPVFTPRCYFALFCYSGSEGQYPFPNTGIDGGPNYQGGWTVEADFVNWYINDTGAIAHYYQPVQGLLLGESYHIIPGSTATSGISLTEDASLSSTFLGHSLVSNHLGPYAQEGVWQISGAHLGGEASGIFEVDLNGLILGDVLAFTWANDFRPISWTTVSVAGAGVKALDYYTFDGLFEMFLAPGDYQLAISGPGYSSQTLTLSVSPGESSLVNVYLQQGGIPVPEFNSMLVVISLVIVASSCLLQLGRKRSGKKHSPKPL